MDVYSHPELPVCQGHESDEIEEILNDDSFLDNQAGLLPGLTGACNDTQSVDTGRSGSLLTGRNRATRGLPEQA